MWRLPAAGLIFYLALQGELPGGASPWLQPEMVGGALVALLLTPLVSRLFD